MFNFFFFIDNKVDENKDVELIHTKIIFKKITLKPK